MIPIAKLRAEYTMTPTPKLIGFHVIVNGKTVAILTPEEVESARIQVEGIGNVG